MKNKKKTAKSWIILGILFLGILFVYAYLSRNGIVSGSYGLEGLLSAVFGFGGTLFLVIGLIKLFTQRNRGNQGLQQ